MESLPEPAQNQVTEHVRNYIEELQDEIQWDFLFNKTQKQLIKAAKRAKQEIAKGYAKPMNYNEL